MSYQYTLIVSQYYHSRHTFVVKHDERFLEKAKAFASELNTYKRDEGSTKPMNLGDLEYVHDILKSSEIRSRYNINDSGDIYFLQSDSEQRCKDMAAEYHEISRRESRGFKSKAVKTAIAEHHDRTKVYDIVQKHFDIA